MKIIDSCSPSLTLDDVLFYKLIIKESGKKLAAIGKCRGVKSGIKWK